MRRTTRLLTTAALAAASVLSTVAPAGAAPEARGRRHLEATAEHQLADLHAQVRTTPTAYPQTADQPATTPAARDAALDRSSRAWADEMARTRTLAHDPELADHVDGWNAIGENVGRTTLADVTDADAVRAAVERLFQAFLESEGHRGNVMAARWDSIGVGVSLVDDPERDWVYVTVRFRETDHARTGEPAARETAAACDDTGDGTTFSDVGPNNVHRAAIECLAAYGISNGRADGTFGPSQGLTRGQMATFVTRTLEAAGYPLPDGAGTCTGSTHAANVDRLIAAGVLDTDCSDGPVTRAAMAEATWRALHDVVGLAPSTTPDYFDDTDTVAGAAGQAIDQTARLGVVTGTTDRTFGPQRSLTRAQMASFLARMLDAALAA